MKVVVLDASVAVKWFVRERNTDEAIRLLDDEATLFVAPDIFRAEVVNALLRRNRSGTFTDQLLDQALLELEATMPQLVASANVMDVAVALARHLKQPIYDCLYLALAERWNTVLVTADEDFVTLCRKRLSHEPLAERLCALAEFRPQ